MLFGGGSSSLELAIQRVLATLPIMTPEARGLARLELCSLCDWMLALCTASIMHAFDTRSLDH